MPGVQWQKNASTRAMSAADSQRGRSTIRHLEKTRAGPQPGDLARAAGPDSRTTWQMPRVGADPPAAVQNYHEKQPFPVPTR